MPRSAAAANTDWTDRFGDSGSSRPAFPRLLEVMTRNGAGKADHPKGVSARCPRLQRRIPAVRTCQRALQVPKAMKETSPELGTFSKRDDAIFPRVRRYESLCVADLAQVDKDTAGRRSSEVNGSATCVSADDKAAHGERRRPGFGGCGDKQVSRALWPVIGRARRVVRLLAGASTACRTWWSRVRTARSRRVTRRFRAMEPIDGPLGRIGLEGWTVPTAQCEHEADNADVQHVGGGSTG